MKTINFLLSGAAGKMGAAIREYAANDESYRLVAAVDRKDKKNLSVDKPGDVQLVIDFSSPQLLEEMLVWCVRAKVPIVSGTTGITEQTMQRLTDAAKAIPVLWAPNFSPGILLFNKLIGQMKDFSSLFTPQIEEVHHAQKKDSPSGTALLLQQSLGKVFQEPLPTPISVRAGGVFGEHSLRLFAEEEVIEIKHTALNRKAFARGALMAGRWLTEKKSGLFGFQDVFGNL